MIEPKPREGKAGLRNFYLFSCWLFTAFIVGEKSEFTKQSGYGFHKGQDYDKAKPLEKYLIPITLLFHGTISTHLTKFPYTRLLIGLCHEITLLVLFARRHLLCPRNPETQRRHHLH